MEKPQHLIERHEKWVEMLMSGRPVAEVAAATGVHRKQVYEYATRHKLPTNAPVKRGAKREQTIVYMATQAYSMEAICRRFKLAPCIVKEVLEDVRQRAAKLDHPD